MQTQAPTANAPASSEMQDSDSKEIGARSSTSNGAPSYQAWYEGDKTLGALIAAVAALVVAIVNSGIILHVSKDQREHANELSGKQLAHAEKLDGLQREHLVNLENAQTQLSDRMKALRQLRRVALSAAKGASQLARNLADPENDVVREAAKAFQAASAFLKVAAESSDSWDLNDDEVEVCGDMEKSLIVFFLALDLDVQKAQRDAYIEKLKAMAKNVRTKDHVLGALLKSHYRQGGAVRLGRFAEASNEALVDA